MSPSSLVAVSRSIRISDELWAALKTRSVALRTTLQAVAEEAAIQYLSLSAAVRSSEGSDAVPARRSNGASTDPLHGIPEAIGTSEEFPMTGRSEYLGQDRSGAVGTGLLRCPACGCVATMHQAGAQGNRCELHPTCRWAPEDLS